MRKFETHYPITKAIKTNRVGKITLMILLILVTFLIYNSVGAKQGEKLSFVDVQEGKRPIVKDSEELNNLEDRTNKRLMYRGFLNKNKELADPKVDTRYEELREDIAKELKGTRMEPMIDTIAYFDRETAALIVGIAKIESGYTHNYQNNFWGYAGGYFGFQSPEHAVKIVGKKIEDYKNKGLNDPSKMVGIWKCGDITGSCPGHSRESVQRWVATSSGPYYRIMNAVKEEDNKKLSSK
ncbi:MAG: hypothetical protein GF347_04060 [Candidatus Moranbacteria bacterium]|nr:hypothetical protein [Candidatus Moranbacteria bacterium]